MILTGVHHKLSTSFHPKTNGASERTNKTVNQCIRFHVERNQNGWVHALPLIHFQMMNMVNKLTGYTLFQLRFGCSPRMLQPLITPPSQPSADYISAREVMERVSRDVADAKDNLMLSKFSQSFFCK